MSAFIDDFFAASMGAVDEKSAAILASLMRSAREGHLCVPLESELPLLDQGAVVHHNNHLYLKRHWDLESKVRTHLRRLLQKELPFIAPPAEALVGLYPEQQRAVEMGLNHSLSILSGGPGTGKTFTAARLASAFLDKKVILAAPTGKAAAQLQSYVLKALDRQKMPERWKCGTLHALLAPADFRKERSLLYADLILVDESSMIDASLFAFLLASIPEGSRLVLMGDPHQLPPVEAGSLFADCALAAESKNIPCTHLSVCLRSDRKEILALANAIFSNRIEEVIAAMSVEPINLESIWQQVVFHFPLPSPSLPKPEDILRCNETFRVLSCLRQGPLGVDALNDYLSARFTSHMRPGDFWLAPILMTKTDVHLGLYNGETGILVRSHARALTDYAYFSGGKTVPASLLPSFEYAYCLSVHKSQGSEYDNVWVLIPEGSEIFGKEVLYTAVTRARTSLTLQGHPEVLRSALGKVGRKLSGIGSNFFE